jgi:membrane-bound inhibitor of C-type lysozyme
MKRNILIQVMAGVGLMTQMPAIAQTQMPDRVTYRCDDQKGFVVNYNTGMTDMIQASFGSRSLMLAKVPSASGVRYSNGVVTVFMKGNAALVDIDNKPFYRNCVAGASTVRGLW